MARIKRVQCEQETTKGSSSKQPSKSPTAAAPAISPAPSEEKPPPRRRKRRRGRTSVERGRAFRKRQDQQEAAQEQQLVRLREEIRDKQYLLSVWEAKYFRSRHTIHGPLVALAHAYHTMFRHGLRSPTASATSGRASEAMQRQEAFIRSAMDPDVLIGFDLQGPQAALEQWRLHTRAFPSFSSEIVAPPQVIGPDHHPIVQVQLRIDVTIGQEMLGVVFQPRARARAARLLGPYMGKPLGLSSRSHMQFTRDNRIAWELVTTDYVQGFLQLGLSLCEVAELLVLSSFTPQSTIMPPTCA